jgi:hypothetical protein
VAARLVELGDGDPADEHASIPDLDLHAVLRRIPGDLDVLAARVQHDVRARLGHREHEVVDAVGRERGSLGLPAHELADFVQRGGKRWERLGDGLAHLLVVRDLVRPAPHPHA